LLAYQLPYFDVGRFELVWTSHAPASLAPSIRPILSSYRLDARTNRVAEDPSGPRLQRQVSDGDGSRSKQPGEHRARLARYRSLVASTSRDAGREPMGSGPALDFGRAAGDAFSNPACGARLLRREPSMVEPQRHFVLPSTPSSQPAPAAPLRLVDALAPRARGRRSVAARSSTHSVTLRVQPAAPRSPPRDARSLPQSRRLASLRTQDTGAGEQGEAGKRKASEPVESQADKVPRLDEEDEIAACAIQCEQERAIVGNSQDMDPALPSLASDDIPSTPTCSSPSPAGRWSTPNGLLPEFRFHWNEGWWWTPRTSSGLGKPQRVTDIDRDVWEVKWRGTTRLVLSLEGDMQVICEKLKVIHAVQAEAACKTPVKCSPRTPSTTAGSSRSSPTTASGSPPVSVKRAPARAPSTKPVRKLGAKAAVSARGARVR